MSRFNVARVRGRVILFSACGFTTTGVAMTRFLQDSSEVRVSLGSSTRASVSAYTQRSKRAFTSSPFFSPLKLRTCLT